MSKLSILIVFIFLSIVSRAQLTFEQFKNINIGLPFKESKSILVPQFLNNYKVLSNGVPGFYKLNIEETPFGNYGTGEYTFKYVKDTLVEATVEIERLIYDRKRFYAILKIIDRDIKNDQSLKLLTTYGKWDINTPIKEIEKIFKDIATEEYIIPGENINDKYFDLKDWSTYFAIYNNNIYTGNILIVQILVGRTSREIGNDKYTKSIYNSGRCMVKFFLRGEKYQDLIQMESGLQKLYTSFKEKKNEIDLQLKNGVYYLPVKVNNILDIEFVLDLGAADVSISPDIFLTLIKAGTIKDSDFIGEKSYQLADGTIAKSNVFNISSLKIGDIEIKNVTASVSNNLSSPLLLGSSALKKIGFYSIDNNRSVLIIQE